MKRAISKIGHIKLNGLTGFLAFSLATLLLPVSCQEDEVTTNARYAKMELVPVLKQYQAADQTRALPEGFVTYSQLTSPPPLPLTTIGVFMMPQATTDVPNPDKPSAMGRFIYRKTDHTWASTVNVEEGVGYYIFGFMPKEDANVATIAPYDESATNDFSSGVKMTIDNLDVVKPADVCVIVGVKQATKEQYEAKTPIDQVEGMDMALGKFSYQGKPETEGNYVYLLLDHIYAGLRFRMRVVDQYAKLRTIVLKKLELKAYTQGVKTVKVEVKLKANSTDTNPAPDPIVEEPVFTLNAASDPTASAATTIYPLEEKQTGITLPFGLKEGSTTEYNYTDFLACLAPSSCTEFDLISTYDVYDRKGNLIRANQTATNHFSDFNQLVRGELQSFEITVSPTYLYMLSEPDLDNPTFTINQ